MATPNPIAQTRGWFWYGEGASLARADLLGAGHAHVRVRGDSFAYEQANRLGRSLMTRAPLAGPIVGKLFAPSYVVAAGTGNIIEASAVDTFLEWGTPIADDGDRGWRAQSAASAYRVSGQDSAWDQFDTEVRSSVWGALLSHKLGGTVDTAGAKAGGVGTGSVELFRFRPRLDLLDAAAVASLEFPGPEDPLVGLRARPIVVAPPVLDGVFCYFGDMATSANDGEVSPTSLLAFNSDRWSRMVANGVNYGSQTAHSVTAPASAGATPRQLSRLVLIGNGEVNGEIQLEHRNADGNPVWSCRMNDNGGQVAHPYTVPGAAAGWTVPAMGAFLLTAYNRADGSIPEGVVWDAPMSMSSASYLDVYTEPAGGVAEAGEKYMGEVNGRRATLAAAIDDRPVVEIVYLAAEPRDAGTLRTQADAMLASIRAEHEDAVGGRVSGYNAPVRIVLVIPHGHAVQSLSETDVHTIFGSHADQWRAAVDAFNASAPGWIRAGVVNLYEATGGYVFGAGGSWSNLDRGRAYLDANGGGSLPTDLLDSGDLHPSNQAAADYFADRFFFALQQTPLSPRRSIVIGSGGSPTWEKHRPIYVTLDREGMAGLAEHDGIGGPGRRGDACSIAPDWTVG